MAEVGAVEYSTLDRFLVSSGALLIAADVAFLWVLAQRADSLLVTEAELGDLTNGARDAIARQQDLLSWVLTWWPFLAGGIALLGIGLIIWGLVQWTPTDRAERSARQAKAKHDAEVYARPATSREVLEEKLDENAEETWAGSANVRPDGVGSAERVVAPPTVPAEGTRRDEQTRGLDDLGEPSTGIGLGEQLNVLHETLLPAEPASPPTFLDWYFASAQFETLVATVIARATSDQYEIYRDIRIGSDAVAGVADLVLLARDPSEPSYVIEVKQVRRFTPAIAVRARNQARELAKNASRAYRTIVKPIALVIYDDDRPEVMRAQSVSNEVGDVVAVPIGEFAQYAIDADWVRSRVLGAH